MMRSVNVERSCLGEEVLRTVIYNKETVSGDFQVPAVSGCLSCSGRTDIDRCGNSYSFIVNVPNKTVVTAMDQTESEDNVYTNIDGAVII